jgi:hypothetical protein
MMMHCLMLSLRARTSSGANSPPPPSSARQHTPGPGLMPSSPVPKRSVLTPKPGAAAAAAVRDPGLSAVAAVCSSLSVRADEAPWGPLNAEAVL